MEETGLVISVCDDNAIIEFRRSSACNHKCSGCGICMVSDNVSIQVKNTVNAKAGDYVCVEMSASTFALAATLLYVAPLIALVASLFITSNLNLSELLQGAVAILTTGIVFLILRLLEHRNSKKFIPRIVKVVANQNNKN